jgi:uncharacterized protein (TIGR02246 family)
LFGSIPELPYITHAHPSNNSNPRKEAAMHFRKTGPLLSLVLSLAGAALGRAQGTLSTDDVAKIRLVHKQYEDAWLKADADAVRALFTDDSVLLPPHASKPWIGQKGLNEFWFAPDAQPTKITKLVVTLASIGGDGRIAYAWGTHEVAWTTGEGSKTTSASHTGTFLNVLRKQANGEWKISHHMWDDAIAKP